MPPLADGTEFPLEDSAAWHALVLRRGEHHRSHRSFFARDRCVGRFLSHVHQASCWGLQLGLRKAGRRHLCMEGLCLVEEEGLYEEVEDVFGGRFPDMT